jgi:hypothetical protein
MRELYVYYRVLGAAAATARAQVLALHAELRAIAPELRTRLLRRPDDEAGAQTWMEVYTLEGAERSGGVDPGLQAEIETRAARLLTAIDGARHAEVFIAVQP